MSVDLDDLLRSAGDGPRTALDPDEVWARGRRRRRVRLAATSAAGLAALAVLAVVPLTLTGGPTPVIEPIGQDEGTTDDPTRAEDPVDGTTEEPTVSDDTVAPPEGPTSEELTEREQQALRSAEEAQRRAVEEAQDATTEPAPQPDPDRVADPCAVHEGGEMRVFIDVVSPVDGQRVDGEVALVGCASVYEGTIQYRIVDGDDVALVEGFTTATAGGPDIGEFRETIAVPGTGARYLEVYWLDVATGSEQHPDGPERDLVRISFTPVDRSPRDGCGPRRTRSPHPSERGHGPTLTSRSLGVIR